MSVKIIVREKKRLTGFRVRCINRLFNHQSTLALLERPHEQNFRCQEGEEHKIEAPFPNRPFIVAKKRNVWVYRHPSASKRGRQAAPNYIPYCPAIACVGICRSFE